MISILKTNNFTGKLEETEKIEKGVWINIVKPTTEEISKICMMLNITENFLLYPLDLAEKPHIDLDNDNTLITVDVPITQKQDRNIYGTIPLGMILVKDDYFVTISQYEVDAIKELLNNYKIFDVYTDKKSRLVFQLLYQISSDFIRYMGYISRDIDMFEKSLQKAMKNKELVLLFSFEKTMIYFNASLKANQSVLQKISRGRTLKLYDEDNDILDDTLIENRQAIEMVQTYSDILNGIIDIFGTIVSNNLNTVMKWLASVTVIIAIPTMIASFMGMNVKFPFISNVPAFYGIIAISIIATLIVTFILKKKDML